MRDREYHVQVTVRLLTRITASCGGEQRKCTCEEEEEEEEEIAAA
jgi:hypothetical protein